jgi:hypothetical protein
MSFLDGVNAVKDEFPGIFGPNGGYSLFFLFIQYNLEIGNICWAFDIWYTDGQLWIFLYEPFSW